MGAEMRPKRIEFDYLPSNSKEAMDNDFDFFRLAFGFGRAVIPGKSVAVPCVEI